MSSLAAAPLASSAKKPFLVVAKESALPPFWGFAFEAVEEEVWERAKGEGWASWLDGQYVLGRGWGEWVWLFRDHHSSLRTECEKQGKIVKVYDAPSSPASASRATQTTATTSSPGSDSSSGLYSSENTPPSKSATQLSDTRRELNRIKNRRTMNKMFGFRGISLLEKASVELLANVQRYQIEGGIPVDFALLGDGHAGMLKEGEIRTLVVAIMGEEELNAVEAGKKDEFFTLQLPILDDMDEQFTIVGTMRYGKATFTCGDDRTREFFDSVGRPGDIRFYDVIGRREAEAEERAKKEKKAAKRKAKNLRQKANAAEREKAGEEKPRQQSYEEIMAAIDGEPTEEEAKAMEQAKEAEAKLEAKRAKSRAKKKAFVKRKRAKKAAENGQEIWIDVEEVVEEDEGEEIWIDVEKKAGGDEGEDDKGDEDQRGPLGLRVRGWS